MRKNNILPIPTINDERFRNLPHKKLLDPLRIIHYNHYGKDPNIQLITADDGKDSMFENGRFLPTSWYKVRGISSYMIQFSQNMTETFTGSILITSDVKNPFSPENFTYFDDIYIQFLTEYIKEQCDGDINLILSDGIFKTLSFGHIYLPNKAPRSYYDFIDCAIEQLCHVSSSRDIIYVGDDIKNGFMLDEIKEGDAKIEAAKKYITQHISISIDNSEPRNISPNQLDTFNETAKTKILRYGK